MYNNIKAKKITLVTRLGGRYMNTIKIYLAESGRVADLHKDFPLYKGQFNDKLLNVYVPTSILAPQFDIQHYIGQMSEAETPTSSELDAFVLANTYPAREPSAGDIVEFYDTTNNTFFLYTYEDDEWVSSEVDSFGTLTNIGGTSVKIGMIGTKSNGATYESKSYFMRYLKTLTYQGVEYALYERKLPKEFTALVGQGQNAPTLIANVVNIDTESKQVLSLVTSQTCKLDVMQSTMLDQDETIEASDLENLTAQVNENSAELLLKQDKRDEGLATTSKFVVGAINEVKGEADTNSTNIYTNTQDIVDIKAEQITQNQDISTNTYNIGINTGNISSLESRVSNLEQQSGVEETYIGQMTGTTLPSDAQLNAFVLETAERATQGGDVVVFVQTIPDATDKIYKYTYSIVTHAWSGYELPATEPASNTTKGLIKGSYNSGLTPATQINVSNGEIEDVYVVDGSDTKRRLAEYLNTDHSTLSTTTAKALQNEQDISVNSGKISTLETSVSNIIDGTTTVAKADRATKDGLGNNISTTYLTSNAGVTKTQMRDYALPRVFNDVSFFTSIGYNGTVPQDPMPIHTLTTSAVGDYTIFTAEKTITNASFQLSSKNSYTDILFASASVNCNVQFRLTTKIYLNGEWVTANVELSETVNMVAGQMKKLSFASTLNSLEEVYSLTDGDKISQKLDVITETSQEIEFDIYSNETYPSTFYLNTTSETIILTQGKLGELPVYSIVGSGDSTKVTFTIPIEAQVANNIEALFILQYSGATTSSTQLELSYNTQAVQIVTPANNGTANPATVGTMLTKYAPNYDRWVFTGIFRVVNGNVSVIADTDNVLAYLQSYYTKSQVDTLLSGKQATLSTAQLNAVNSGIDSSKVSQIATNTSAAATNAANISTLQSTTSSLQSQVSNHTTSIAGLTSRVTAAEGDIATIEGKIPTQASSSNQLADKQFVNSTIQTATAHFRGNWATWSAVPTSASGYPADAEGNTTPTSNDYMVVQDASGYTGSTLSGTWRFKYSGVWSTDGTAGWLPEYQVNETPLTSAQLDALNSGATTTNIGQIATNTTNIGLNTAAIGDNTSAISGLTTRVGTVEGNISAIPNNYVSYTSAQTLTDAQKLQARQNIGAGTGGGASTNVKVDGTSITSNNEADILTINGNYNASSNKIATASDLPDISGLATASSVNSLAGRVTDTENDITAIEGKIPSGASSSNQLVDTTTMNSSISTATATFRGTFNLVSDLSLTTSATHSQIATALASAISTADNNDYCFVQIPTADGTPTQIAQVDRYKYSSNAWAYEYTLNNSGYTAAQWAAINSGANTTNIGKIATNESAISGLSTSKQDKIDNSHKLSADLVDDTSSSNKFMSSNTIKNVFGIELSASGELKAQIKTGQDYTNLWNDAFISKGTLEGAAVKLTGNQTISGTKTFSGDIATDKITLGISGGEGGVVVGIDSSDAEFNIIENDGYGNINIGDSVNEVQFLHLYGQDILVHGDLNINGGNIQYDSSTDTFYF